MRASCDALLCGDWLRDCCRAAGACAKAGRHPARCPSRQPGQHVDPRGSDDLDGRADDGGVQQSRHVRPARAAEQHCNRSCRIWPPSWSWSEDGTELTFRLREGVKWHDGKPFTAKDVKCTWDLLLGKAADKFRINPRKSWYSQPRPGHHQRRLRGHLSSEAAAAGADRAARLRLFAGLSLPCAAARHAPASDRHRPVQIRRVQAERVDPADPQPGLLETGPALSRRHRIYDHPEPLDGAAGLCRRQARHDLSLRGDRPAAEGHQEPGAAGDLRAAAEGRQQHI